MGCQELAEWKKSLWCRAGDKGSEWEIRVTGVGLRRVSADEVGCRLWFEFGGEKYNKNNLVA